MATRSRRSAGGDTGGVNVNLIQLYDLGRLKKELESRGLSIVGKKHELADRLEAAVTGTYTPDVPTPSPKPPRERKSIKKEPSEAVEIKEEPADEKPVVPKKTPKKRARKSKETIEEEEAEEPVATTSEPPVKKAPKVKVEVEDEPVPKKKKPRKSVEEAPPPTPVVEACTDAVPEFTDDVPLLSLLAGKKQIKMEDDEEVDEDENAEKPTHSHGTRRAVAMKTPKSKDEPVVERMKFVEISGSDIFDDDDSPDYIQPERSSPPPKESKPRITEEIRAKDKKKKLETRPIKMEPSPVPRKPPVTDLWAQKLAELKKKNETTNTLPSPTAVGSKPKIVELKPKPKIPQPTVSVSASSFVLDDILSTHEQQAQEKKRKQEQEELERKEAERRHKEKMAEFRKKQAEDEAKRAEKMKNRPPKPVPEPKTVVELKPHPYARPVSVEEVEKKVEVKAKTTETKSVRRLPPPPPPPPIPGRSVSSSSSVDSPASTSSKTDAKIAPRQRLPPPPPPPPIPKLPAPSKPAEDVDENGTRHDEEKEKPTVAAADSSEGEVDTAAVTMFAEVMLKALKDRQLRAPVSQDEEIEEYDPFVNENGDLDASAYVPSTVGTRNNTMIEEDEEYEEVPSDDEIVGEVEDEEDTDESESEPEEPTSNLSPTKKRAPAGADGEMEKLLQNPRDLLLKASTVVFSNPTEEVVDPEGPQYIQMPCADDYEPEEEEKKTPEYHGEPVPDDDEIDFFALAAGIQPKKKKEIVIEEEKLPSDESIEPDYYNADLHIKGAADKNYIIEPENADGQALMWGGVRTTYGIRLPFRDVKKEDQDENAPTKKIVFQIKILEFMSTKHLPFEELDPHDVRVGFSLGSTSLILGESLDSYCISSLGKKATNSFFADFVANSVFHLNDVITACLDLEAGTISYWKNDLNLGVAFTNIALPDGDAIFPHICIKNCRVAVNFGGFEGDDEDHPWRKNEEWRFMADLGRGDLIRSRKSPDSKAECTVLMMVGLPGVGKTTWVREYLRDHPEENWTLINHESVLASMKVNGVSRKRAHQGRWDMIMGLIGKSLQRCVLLAARRRKNYILDMTNTSRETRKKRLQLFEEFRRKCVILMPTDEVMADRQARQARQDGTAQVPPEAMLEMKAVISLPSQEFEPFEDIYFIEPPVNRIQDCIDQINRYNEEARPWFQKKYKRRRSQMIGLGDGIQRNDPMMPRKPMQPLTVLPQLKIAVVPLDDPSNPGPLSASSSHDSAPTSASALGFSVVEDRTPSRPPVHISIDTTIPPPHITPGMKPLVRVTIQDISAPFYRPGDTAQPTIDDQAPELTEQELNQLRDSVKAANPSGNPMMSEAIMRSRLKAMQLKKIEAREGRLPMPIPLSSTPVGNRIPTLGAPISVDTSFSSNSPRGSTSGSFVTPSPSSFSQPPPNISMTSPSIPPPGLMSFNLPPPPISMPPSNVINGSYSWSQNNGN